MHKEGVIDVCMLFDLIVFILKIIINGHSPFRDFMFSRHLFPSVRKTVFRKDLAIFKRKLCNNNMCDYS